jgi:hypothetical protein
MRKTKRFGVGGMSDEEGKKSVFSERLSSDESKRRAIKNYKPEEYKAPRAYSESSDTPTKRIITKEQVEAKGFTNLQDFLNDERKLKRRDGKPVERAKSTSSVSGDDLSKYYANQNKAAETTKSTAAAPKKEEKEEGSALALAIPAALATAAAVFGVNKMAKKEDTQRQALEDLRNARSERESARLKEARATTAEAEKIAKESLDTKAKRGMSRTGGGGGGGGGMGGGMGGGESRRKRLGERNIEFKRGGKIKRFATGGEVAAKKTPEPPISKATQESMKRQAAQAKIDRKQAEEQKAGEKEVRDNMGRIGFKKGGSASSRADGCAIRGKTRA